MAIDRIDYPGVPINFPIEAAESALLDTQLKLCSVEENGKFYSPGTSPGEVKDAYEVCEDLAQQMVPFCTRKMAELGLPHEEILDKLLLDIYQKSWVSPAHARWILERTRHLLGWDATP